MKTKAYDKDEGDDVMKQINKSHKAQRDKIKKKRKMEKDIKKKKKDKKKVMESRKQKKKEKRQGKNEESDGDEEGATGGNKDAKLLKYLKKLRIFMEEEADDLFEMFETIDNGGEVDIEGLENGKVKNYLKKIFKYLELRKNPETKEFSKDPDIHTELLRPRITDLWYQGVGSDSGDSDDERRKKKDGSIDEEESDEEPEKRADLNEEQMGIAKNALMQGIQALPEAEEKTAEEAPVAKPKAEDWKDALDDTFGSLLGADDKSGYSKLGAKKNVVAGEDRTDRDKKVEEFMKDYNSQFRKKTLLEEHQEKKRMAQAGKPIERRAFDKNQDLDMSRIDSKKVFQMLNNKDNNLGSRFSNSMSGNKFL